MSDWKTRLTQVLEPALSNPDPRPLISAYHDMPYAIFRYPPEAELMLRSELALLETRLTQAGKRVSRISLAECLEAALEADGESLLSLAEAERSVGLAAVVDTVSEILGGRQPLDDIVVGRMPEDGDPERDVVLIVRAGALFPFYRTSALLEQLMCRVDLPCILFYPGEPDGAAGLRFMGVLDAEHNYRPRIF